jgi:TolA-binding protein
MTCEEAREAFTDLYDGTLSGPPLVVLSQHLDACAACRAEWADFRRTMQALEELGDEEPSPGFAARVAEQVEAPSWWHTMVTALVFPWRVKVPIHAVALVLLCIVGLWMFQRSPDVQQATNLRAPVPAERPAPPPPAPFVSPPPSAKAPEATPPPAQPSKTATPEAPAAATAPRVTGKTETPNALREQAGAGEGASTGDEASKPSAPPPGAALKRAETDTATLRPLRSATNSTESRGAVGPAPPAGSGSTVTPGARSPSTDRTADEIFSAAATEFAAQQYETAIQDLQIFLAQYPDDGRAPDARFLLADSYRAERRYAEAQAGFDEFLRQYPGHRQAPAARYRQAEIRLATGDPSGCAMLRDALSRYPGVREAGSARETLSAQCP